VQIRAGHVERIRTHHWGNWQGVLLAKNKPPPPVLRLAAVPLGSPTNAKPGSTPQRRRPPTRGAPACTVIPATFAKPARRRG
jgi:hypothetical protein